MNYFAYKRESERNDKSTIIFIKYCEKCCNLIIGKWEIPKSNIDIGTISYDHSGDVFSNFLSSGWPVDHKEIRREYRYKCSDYTGERKKISKECYNSVKELIASDEFKQIVDFRKEIFEFLNNNMCPVCNEELSHEKNYLLDNNCVELGISRSSNTDSSFVQYKWENHDKWKEREKGPSITVYYKMLYHNLSFSDELEKNCGVDINSINEGDEVLTNCGVGKCIKKERDNGKLKCSFEYFKPDDS